MVSLMNDDESTYFNEEIVEQDLKDDYKIC